MLSMNIKAVPLCALVFLASFSTQAKTYRCTDKDGKVSYGTSPCKDDVMEKEIRGIKLTSESNPDLQNKVKQSPGTPRAIALKTT
jgi:Domain of unknown function (DUF4124)